MPQALLEWVERKDVDAGTHEGLTNSERERLKQLERENEELRPANVMLKVASACFTQGELDRRLKSRSASLTNTVICTGSSPSDR